MKRLFFGLFLFHFFIYALSAYSEDKVLLDNKTQKEMTEIKNLFAKLNKKYKIEIALNDKALNRKTNRKIRGIEYYNYSISRGWPAFSLDKLRKGKLPYYGEGDFNCDGKLDKVFIVDNSNKQNDEILILLSNNKHPAIEEEAPDYIQISKKGTYKTAEGKGYGSTEKGEKPEPTEFTSKCDFIEGIWSEKSSFSLVYDKKTKTFIKYWTSD